MTFFAMVVLAIALPAMVLAIVAAVVFSNEDRADRAEAAIIEILAKHSDLRGLAIVKYSNGAISRGAVYVYLARMEENGLVSSFTVGQQRFYALTARGRLRTQGHDQQYGGRR